MYLRGKTELPVLIGANFIAIVNYVLNKHLNVFFIFIFPSYDSYILQLYIAIDYRNIDVSTFFICIFFSII